MVYHKETSPDGVLDVQHEPRSAPFDLTNSQTHSEWYWCYGMLDECGFHVLICYHNEGKNLKILARSDNSLDVITWGSYLSREPRVMCEDVAHQIGASFDLVYLQAECAHGAPLRPTLLIFEVNSDEIPEPPDNHKWIAQASSNEIEVHPPTKPVIRYLEKFRRYGLEVSAERLFPYSRGGWFQVASQWLKTALMEKGHKIEAVTQFRHGIECSMLIAESESGSTFYMKALPPRAFNDEVTVSCSLAQAMPRVFPRPLLVRKEKKWMIMRDYGPTLSPEECTMRENPDLVHKVLCEWAKVQKESIPMLEELKQSGIPLHDQNRFKERVTEMLDHPEYIDAQWEVMTDEERQLYGKEGYKQEFYAYVERLLRHISEYNVPLTLVHGDLNAANVFLNGDGNFMFLDHAYTRISFPFLDATWFLMVCLGRDESLDFYLNFWTDFETLERLQELVRLIKDLRKVEMNLQSFHFFLKAQEGMRDAEREELANPMCSEFEKYL